jgi:hypothetical protein
MASSTTNKFTSIRKPIHAIRFTNPLQTLGKAILEFFRRFANLENDFNCPKLGDRLTTF